MFKLNDLFVPYKDGFDIKPAFIFTYEGPQTPVNEFPTYKYLRLLVDIGRDSSYWLFYSPDDKVIYRCEKVISCSNALDLPDEKNGFINILRFDGKPSYQMKVIEKLNPKELLQFTDMLLKIDVIHERAKQNEQGDNP